MKRTLRTATLALIVASVFGLGTLQTAGAQAKTPAGTAINNTASATYKDPANNSYSTQSNTVTTIVQNAPLFTVTTNGKNSTTSTQNGTAYNYGDATQGTPPSVVVPGANVPAGSSSTTGGSGGDVYTLTNIGNVSGSAASPAFFQVTAATAAGSASVLSYTVAFPGGTLPSQCGTGTFATLGAPDTTAVPPVTTGTLNYCLWYLSTVSNVAGTNAVNVSVNYAVNFNAALPGSTGSTLTANLTYLPPAPNPSGLTATTGGPWSNTYIDPIAQDAQLNLNKASCQQGGTIPCTLNGAGEIQYTITSINGGATGTHYVNNLTADLGLPAAGLVALVDKVPTFGAAPLVVETGGGFAPKVTSTTGLTPAGGAPAVTVYYTTSAVALSGSTVWTSCGGATCTTISGTPTYFAVVLSGGTPTTGTCVTPQVQCGLAPGGSLAFQFVVKPPAGPGSGDPGSVKNYANSVIGSNASTPCLIGPTVSPNLANSCAGNASDTPGNAQGVANAAFPNPALPNAPAGPSGQSNLTLDSALASYQVFTGPVSLLGGLPNLLTTGCATGTAACDPQTIGSFNGGTANNNDDFTARGFCSVSGGTLNTSVFTGLVGGLPTGTPIPTASCAIPASGVPVPNSLQNAGNHIDTIKLTVNSPGFNAQICQDNGAGAPLIASCAATLTYTNVASGGSLVYWVLYKPSTATVVPFFQNDAIVTAAGTGVTNTNTTHNDLYAGFVYLNKSQSVTTSGCPSGVTLQGPGFICPSGIVDYSVAYTNMAYPGSPQTGTGGFPAIYPAGAVLVASQVVITEDGQAKPGPTQVPPSGTTPGQIILTPGTLANSWGTFGTITGTPTDSTGGTVVVNPGFITDTIPSLAPRASGTLAFSVLVK